MSFDDAVEYVEDEVEMPQLEELMMLDVAPCTREAAPMKRYPRSVAQAPEASGSEPQRADEKATVKAGEPATSCQADRLVVATKAELQAGDQAGKQF